MIREIFVIVAALIGFFLAFYIYRKTSRNEKLVCVLGEDCNKVVYSRYANILGVPNEVIGMLYFALIAVAYSAFIFIPELRTPLVSSAFLLGSGVAAGFSLFLVFVQLFILKEWCEWCLASALLSVVIFILLFF